MTPDARAKAKVKEQSAGGGDGQGLSPEGQANKSDLLDDEEDFFDFISRFQSKRMDDQRCSLADNGETEPEVPTSSWFFS